MKKNIEMIAGDTSGVNYAFPWFSFDGQEGGGAPAAYLQGALHADELPGPAALHFLLPLLQQAEAEGRIRGKITVIPQANPIGTAQWVNLKMSGRFALPTRENFNRNHPVIAKPDPNLAREDETFMSIDQRLKQRLARLSLGHQIILDLHCDDEGLNYVYIAKELWPQTQDLATCLEADAVLLWQGDADMPFEAAALHPYLAPEQNDALANDVVVSTLELRGQADVDPQTAKADAERLLHFLEVRGVIAPAQGNSAEAPTPYQGLAVPLEHIEMLQAPCPGVVLYHVKPGDQVQQGDLLVQVVRTPGVPEDDVLLHAPQAGTILTRRGHRYTRAGDDLLKLLGSKRSASAREGILEA
ncbi:succinylglutamate desuccinylase/aspartoacylase family protein [Polycladidibacter hongkongensis]|uniref:succinylglutamate desuccinylase/aspartoacylase family protein n=1 Tax=Polycladidibacter hongkongensis TaxID=1647556 RepID=UPI00082D105D|nr:succinylglutamate desuccinylase/aspartoacylase family protein [Pseudovibrio hongkongensis]